MVRREDIPWEELQRLNAQGWSYRRLAEKYGVSSSAIGRRAVLEGWHGTNDQRQCPAAESGGSAAPPGGAAAGGGPGHPGDQGAHRRSAGADEPSADPGGAAARRRRGPGGAGEGNGGLEPVTEKNSHHGIYPTPPQQEFLRCRKKYVAFGGAGRRQKLGSPRQGQAAGLRYPGIRLLLVRRTYQELEANHIRFLRQELAGLAEYRATARQFVFPNGSVLDFGYCAADGDMESLSGGGIRRDLPGRGHPAEGGVAAAVCRLPAGRQRISQAAVLHLQPRRRDTAISSACSSTGGSRRGKPR